MISTGVQKTAVRKTAVRKLVPQEQQTGFRNNKQENTRTNEGRVCVSLDESKISEFDRKCIDWTIGEYRKTGQLKNEAGLRVFLLKAAMNNTLDRESYEAFLAASKQKVQATNEVLDMVRGWEKECEDDPITPEFFEEQRRLFPGLFAEAGESLAESRGMPGMKE